MLGSWGTDNATSASNMIYLKNSSKGLTLADNLEIASFKFARTDYWDEKDKLHKEGGLIKLK